MGQAKQRRLQAKPTVYHHTSTLRTNLLWMSGVIELEGRGEVPLHPIVGPVGHGAPLRRSFKDFPPLAWFTSRIEVPNCLQQMELYVVDPKTGARRPFPTAAGASPAQLSAGISLHRIAIGFQVSDIGVQPWTRHPGYATAEGGELNESARAIGDDPDEWYVSEAPVEILKASEIWGARTKSSTRLYRNDAYLLDVKKMVTLCRTQKAFIPPSWMSTRDAEALAQRMGVPVGELR